MQLRAAPCPIRQRGSDHRECPHVVCTLEHGDSEIACAKGKVSHQRQRAVASKRTCAGLQKRRDQLPAEYQLLLQSGQRSPSVMRQVKGFGYDQMTSALWATRCVDDRAVPRTHCRRPGPVGSGTSSKQENSFLSRQSPNSRRCRPDSQVLVSLPLFQQPLTTSHCGSSPGLVAICDPHDEINHGLAQARRHRGIP